MVLCPRCENTLPEPTPPFCPHCGAEVGPLPLPAPGAGGPPPPPEYGEPAQAAPDAPGSPPPVHGTPWEHRARLGFATALAETVKQTLFSPTELFRSVRPTGGLGEPLLYGVIVGWTAQIVASFYQLILNTIVGGARLNADLPPALRHLAIGLEGTGGFLASMLFGWLIVLIGLFVGAGLVHLVLLILGAARRGFEATFHVACYAQTAALFAIVPFCGGPIGGVYGIVLSIIGLSEVHGISKGQAAAAVLLPMLFCCCCAGLAMAVTLGSVASMVGSMH